MKHISINWLKLLILLFSWGWAYTLCEAAVDEVIDPDNTSYVLCLDVGNTDMLGGVYAGSDLKMTFRYNTSELGSADQLGIFLVNVLKQHQIKPQHIAGISLSCVVPTCHWVIHQACLRYLPQANYYELTSTQCYTNASSPIRIQYKNYQEIGSDLLANAIGAIEAQPGRNLLIIDMGTATTICAVTKNKEFLGGCIFPGIDLWAKSLNVNTAQLPKVSLESNHKLSPLGTNTTAECIQAGIYYGHLGALKEIITRAKTEFFKADTVVIVGTGGHCNTYQSEKLFDYIMPELVLQGLLNAYNAFE